jgi:hypothetical protein
MRVGWAGLLALGFTGPALAPDAPAPHPDQITCAVPPGESTGFSACAISLYPAYDETGGGSVALASPDGRSNAVVGPGDDLKLSGAIGGASERVMKGPNGAMAWSPDSRGLFVTINDGGAVGSFDLIAFVPVRGKLVKRDLTALVHRIYRQPGRCFEPEPPNVAGVAWLGSYRRLLVAGQTLPHSMCDSMGNFTAYVIDPVTMQVIETVGQIDAKARWSALMGPQLQGADDNCVRDRRACMIPQLHPELRFD